MEQEQQTIYSGSDSAELAARLHEFPLPDGVVPNGRAVVFVVAEPWHTTDWTTDFGFLVRELRQRGYHSGVVCTQVVGPPRDYPTFAVPEGVMASPDFWRPWRLHEAVVMTWLLMATEQIKALRKAGAFVVSKGDSDGLEGMRVHPWAQLNRLWHRRKTRAHQWEGAYTLAKKYVYSHRKEDALLLSNLRQAHVTLLESDTARHEFARFVGWTKAGLEDRLHTLPGPVAPGFLNTPICPRENRVVAIGRWDDPQKDAPLLVRTLRRFAAACPDTQVTILGGGGDAVFAPLTQDCPQVRYVGRVPHAEIVTHLQTARTLLFSSRWEGSPISANEMLSLGGTIVAPASLPGLHSIAHAGPFGTVARPRTGDTLANALREEMRAWDEGRRDPEQIAAHWRPQFTPSNLVDALLAFADTSPR